MTAPVSRREEPIHELPELATRRQVAQFTQIHETTLARWAADGKGPQLIRIGGPNGTIRYRRGDVLAWIEASTTGAA